MIIGACSIVKKDIPCDEIFCGGGDPARYLVKLI